jgi:HAD superfamily hydrolase (TIGR01509 family)
MEHAIRVVVFDLGNVLIEWDRGLLYRPMFPNEETLSYFLDSVYTLEANERFDRGQSLHDFTAELAAAHPTYAREVLALRDRWIETIGAVNEDVVAILRELRDAGVPVYALSNWNADTFALVEPLHPFLGWFDGLVISGREGLVKPEPAIFELLADRYGFALGDALFIDDSRVNVDGARSAGMDAVVFDDAATLRGDLVSRRLL